MIKLEEALEIVFSSAKSIGFEKVKIEKTLGRVLAEDIVSDINMPPFNKSAMDGFACRREDLKNELTIIETIAAGDQPTKIIQKNQCSKIMTGAPVPDGADCVIMIEYTQETAPKKIRFTAEKTSDNICIKAEDVNEGDVLVKSGNLIGPAEIAAFALAGAAEPIVSKQPKVGIIATGDELVAADEKPTGGQIRNSNGYQLAAQAELSGSVVTNYGIVEDTREVTIKAIEKASIENDCIIISGGVSVGDYDYVPDCLRVNGYELLIEKIRVKPGRPMVFGVKDADGDRTKYCFGLPGNPVSTFVLFEVFVKPFLYRLQGHIYQPSIILGNLDSDISRKKADRDAFVPVEFCKDGQLKTVEYHGVAHIHALSNACGLIHIPRGETLLKKGIEIAVRQIR